MKELNNKDQVILKELISLGGRDIPRSSNLVKRNIGYVSKDGKITGLRLSHSHLTELPESIGFLPSLKLLNLSYSKGTLPYSILRLKTLTSLDISFCEIYEFPRKSLFSMIQCLDNLESLNIVGCPISSDILSQINNVLFTNFEDIYITLLGLSMGQGIIEPNFQALRCPEEVCDLPKLEEIWLRGISYKPDLKSIKRFNKEQTERYKIN